MSEQAGQTDQTLADLDSGGPPAPAAGLVADPGATPLVIVRRVSRQMGVDWTVLAQDLREANEKLRRNDLSSVEDMLMQQAVALQMVFTRLTDFGLSGMPTKGLDLMLRHGLRAQAQCRATLETLAAVKSPPAVYARQANVTTGPQQINNGVVAPSAPKSAQGGDAHELSANGGTPAPAIPADPAMAAVGAVDRAADGGGQGEVVAQRLERRAASRAASTRQRAA